MYLACLYTDIQLRRTPHYLNMFVCVNVNGIHASAYYSQPLNGHIYMFVIRVYVLYTMTCGYANVTADQLKRNDAIVL